MERRRGRGTGEERELATLATMVPSLRGSGQGRGHWTRWVHHSS